MRYAIAACLVITACGSDPIDLTGVYRVDSAIGSMPCGTDATIDFAPFVRFTKTDFLGAPLFQYDGCMDEAATDCSSLPGLFGEPQDDGWLGRTSSSSGGGGFPCGLGLTRQTATLHGSALEIESTSSQGTVDGLSEEQCSPDEAEKRADELPCTEHSLVEATKL
jgi:hypothetical protein